MARVAVMPDFQSFEQKSKEDAPMMDSNPLSVGQAMKGKLPPDAKLFYERIRERVKTFMNEPGVQMFLVSILMLSLFMHDSWIWGNAADNTNVILYSTLLAVFVIFCIEMTILVLVEEGYLFSFFFWMDAIGTLSILLDVAWIADAFIPSGSQNNSGRVLRATRAAKLGARYGRLLRLLKLLKVMKSIPCLNYFQGGDEFEPTMKSIKKVAEELSALLSMRIAFLVLIIVIVMPFLTYSVTDFSPNAWIDNMRMVARNETVTAYDISFTAYKCKKFFSNKDSKVLHMKIESPWTSTFIETYHTRHTLRQGNVLKFLSSYHVDASTLLLSGIPSAMDSANKHNSSNTSAVYFNVNLHIDSTTPNAINAMYSVIIILMVIFILFAFTGSFNRSTNKLVVKPLEKLLMTLRHSAETMFKALNALEKGKKKENGEVLLDDDDDEMQTAMLEKMVDKVAKIVQHIMPDTNLVVDSSLDASTATWLSSAYSSDGASVVRDTKIGAGVSYKMVTSLDADSRSSGVLTSVEQTQSLVTKEVFNSWEFDVLKYTNDDLCTIMYYQFSQFTFFEEFKVPSAAFKSFLSDIAEAYINTNTYHNFSHGCDVAHTSYRLVMITSLDLMLSSLELFSLLIGALGHDVGHPGLNNLYLVKAKHDLALKHNDKSPLENMHCAVLYELLRKPSSNVFVNLSDAQWRASRKVILTTVLGTDMSHHMEQITKTNLFGDLHSEDTHAFYKCDVEEIDCLRDDKNRLFIMELVLHCSDISNPYKPFAISAKWAELVVQEFWLQGDRERDEGLEISPSCDRNGIGLSAMQLGFIEFFVAPLINAMISLFPPLTEIGDHMRDNFVAWGNRRRGEIANDGSKTSEDIDVECKKVDERIQKFRDKMNFMDDLKTKVARRREKSAFTTNKPP